MTLQDAPRKTAAGRVVASAGQVRSGKVEGRSKWEVASAYFELTSKLQPSTFEPHV